MPNWPYPKNYLISVWLSYVVLFLGNNGALWHKGERYIGFWLHRQYLLLGLIYCWFVSFLKISYMKKYVITSLILKTDINTTEVTCVRNFSGY